MGEAAATLRGMRALVVGGSGFVGRNLTRFLTSEGHSVTVIDRIPDATGTFTGDFVQGDAQDPDLLAAVISQSKPDVVYHLAANSDISAGVADASLDFGDTLMTTIALRQAIAKNPVKKLVFASSSAIFGAIDSPLGEVIEGYAEPASWYGRAKLASEYVLESLAAEVPSMGILMVRFPNVVGPLATHGVIFDFVRKLRADPSTLQVLGDGHQTKPYVHVSELIEGIEFFNALTQAGVKRVNIGPPDTVDVRGIANEVAEAMNLTPEILYQDSPFGWPGDIPRYSFDTSQMRAQGFAIDTTSRSAVRLAADQLALEIQAL